MSAETRAFALQKKGVILWRGQALLDRRAREKEKERKEKGKEAEAGKVGSGSKGLELSTDILAMMMPKAWVQVVYGPHHTSKESNSLCRYEYLNLNIYYDDYPPDVSKASNSNNIGG